MLLVRSGQHVPTSSEYETVKASDAVQDAIDRLPTNNSFERELTKLVIHQDFHLFCPRLLVTHTIVNLLKNAVYYSQKSKQPAVEVHVGRNREHYWFIRVMDNGSGISKESRRRLFQPFFTTTQSGEGNGIGLSFCKKVMDDLGGEIHLVDEPGFSTCFELTFPRKSCQAALEPNGKLNHGDTSTPI